MALVIDVSGSMRGECLLFPTAFGRSSGDSSCSLERYGNLTDMLNIIY